jgi:hypothetical protein
MSNSSCEITFKAVDYTAYYFRVADKRVSVLHLRINLQLALCKDLRHNRGNSIIKVERVGLLLV